MDKSDSLMVPQKLKAVWKYVQIRDGKLYHGAIGKMRKQELHAMHSAIVLVGITINAWMMLICPFDRAYEMPKSS